MDGSWVMCNQVKYPETRHSEHIVYNLVTVYQARIFPIPLPLSKLFYTYKMVCYDAMYLQS